MPRYVSTSSWCTYSSSAMARMYSFNFPKITVTSSTVEPGLQHSHEAEEEAEDKSHLGNNNNNNNNNGQATTTRRSSGNEHNQSI